MAYASPVSGDGGRPGSYPVFHMPVAITVARGFQIVFAFVVVIMAGVLMHGWVFSAEAFALVCGLFTLVITLYAILTEKVASCRSGYNYWAVFSLDLAMIIFWLSSMAANAALRATFTISASATCYDDGSAVNADSCYVNKRRSSGSNPLAKRDVYYASNGALALMSAIAGVSALLMLLFVATFAYLAHQIRMHRQAESRGVASDDAGVVEMKTQATATTTPAYPSTGYVGASGAGYAEVPNPTSGSTQHYAGGGGGYSATYDYPSAGTTPIPSTQEQSSVSMPANYGYGQPQQSAQGQYPGVPQQLHSYSAPAAPPGAGQYYGPQ